MTRSKCSFLNTAGLICFLNLGEYINIHPKCYSGAFKCSHERNHLLIEGLRFLITELSGMKCQVCLLSLGESCRDSESSQASTPLPPLQRPTYGSRNLVYGNQMHALHVCSLPGVFRVMTPSAEPRHYCRNVWVLLGCLEIL